MLNRANNLPLKPEDKQQEEMIIKHMAKANGYPTKLIKNLQKKITKDTKMHGEIKVKIVYRISN
jgi:hypothetical protein